MQADNAGKTRKEKISPFGIHFNEKPSIIPGCAAIERCQDCFSPPWFLPLPLACNAYHCRQLTWLVDACTGIFCQVERGPEGQA